MITLDLPRRPVPRVGSPARMSYRSYYAGAQTNRLTQDWMGQLLSADQAIKCDLRALRGRSRKLFEDNGHFAGAAKTLKNNLVGPEGIRLNPRVTSPRGKLLTEDNDAIEEAFTRWGEPGVCTADGRGSWWENTRMAVGAWMMDGELFVRHLRGFDNEFGYAVQFLDPDLLDERYNVLPSKGQNEIRMGVEVDRWSRPIRYWFWDRHPSEAGGRRERVPIPAADIEHLYVQHRPGQTRGIPAATPVLILSRMLDGFTEAEVIAARIGASGGGGFFWMSAEDAQTLGVPTPTEEDLKTPLELEAEPGLSRQLPPGWQHQEWDPAHPNGRFYEFQKAILRVIAKGMGLSYMTLAGDLSDTSYASGRMGLQAERDDFRSDQRFFGSRLCTPVYRNFVRYGSLAGAVPLPYPDVSRCLAHEWEYRGWPWIDPKSDIDAAAKAIALRVKSRQQICAELGTDFAEVIDDHKEEEEIAAAAGIDLPMIDAGNSAPIPDEPPPKDPQLSNGNGNGEGKKKKALDLLPLEVHR